MGLIILRCWLADVFLAYSGKSQNYYNNLMLKTGEYTGSLPNPFNNLVTKSERFINEYKKDKSSIECLSTIMCEEFIESGKSWKEKEPDEISIQILKDRILMVQKACKSSIHFL